MTVTNPTSKLDEDWKLEFANGTTIKGVGSPPEVWRLVGASKENTKKNSKGTIEGVLLPNVSQEEAKDDANSRNRIAPNNEIKEDIGKARRLRELKVGLTHHHRQRKLRFSFLLSLLEADFCAILSILFAELLPM